MAAPAEPRTPNMHRANESLLDSADGSMATVATRRKSNDVPQTAKIDLTPTGLLMEGHYTQNPDFGSWAMVADVFLSLHLLNQPTKWNLQCFGDASHVHKANVSRAPFDITDVRTVNVCEFREPLLGKGTLQAKLPNSLSEGELRVALLWRSHEPDARSRMAMSLQTISGYGHTSIVSSKVTHCSYGT
jgi:hypothetical protein